MVIRKTIERQWKTDFSWASASIAALAARRTRSGATSVRWISNYPEAHNSLGVLLKSSGDRRGADAWLRLAGLFELLNGRIEAVVTTRRCYGSALTLPNYAVFLEGCGEAAKVALKTAPEHGRSSARRVSMRFSLMRKRRPGANLRWVDRDKPDVEAAGRTANNPVNQIGQPSLIRQDFS